MQTQLVIDKGGVTGAATKDTPPRGGVLVIRSRKRYVVTLATDISCVALVALLSTLRAINSPIELVVGGETFHLRPAESFV